MGDLSLGNLSPEKRALLEQKLQQRRAPLPTNEAPAGVASTGPQPLSYAQESFWFFDQLVPESPLYNIPQALRLRGALDAEALRRALDAIVQRHEILRTRVFPSWASVPSSYAGGEPVGNRDQAPVQVVFPHEEFALPIHDLSALTAAEQQAELQKQLEAEAKRPFQLTRDLMLRALLVRCSPEEHVLLLSVHHIAADVWSLGVLYEELQTFYEAFRNGQAAALPAPPTQFPSYAAAQRAATETAPVRTALEYWQKELGGEVPRLSLPTDRQRPGAVSYRGAREIISYPAQLLASIKELSRKEGTTVYVVLLAAFQALLHRYSGQSEIVVGSPIGARQERQTEKLIGLFVNMVALRTDVSGNPTFRELLRRTRQKVLGAIAHQDAPLELLVERMAPARHAGVNPFFQTVFQYLAKLPTLRLAGLAVESLPMETGTAKFDITLTLGESGEGLIGDLEYNTDLFDQSTISRMLGHFRTLLEGAASNPEQHIALLPMLSKAEKQQLSDWNETSTPYPGNGSIKELFERQVQTSPDSVALLVDGREISYQELNAQANRVAHYLIKAGVGPDMPVGVCLERSAELVAALLGIIKAGGAYVPLDPGYPPERLAYMLEDAAVRFLITTAEWQRGQFHAFPGKVVRIDQDEPEILSQSVLNPPNCVATESLAYIIYTSGSTGKPKGVLVPQRGVIRLVKEANYVQFSPDDVFLLFAPISFDASTFEIWGSLLNGAKLVVFPARLDSLEQLGQTLQETKVTTLWLTAGLFHQMVEEHIGSLKGIRKLLAGGDVLSVSHVLKTLRELPGTQLINGYGPTENTTFTCCYSVPRSWAGEGPLPIGRPISNTQVFVLDGFGQPVPIGIPGELVIGGDGLARGYINAPELMAEKFVPNHFSPKAGPRLYRTGDLVRWLADGNIEFLGRLDQQLKIRGFRVEPGEIENALAQHPAVRGSVVVALSDGSGGKKLVAYVTGPQGPGIGASELREFLEKKLPAYMIPAHFVVLAQFPLNPNGKVDRHLLPAPECEAVGTTVAPRNAEESALAEIWREVLHLDEVGVHDNFFALGGHSLLATRVISRVARLTGAEIPLRDIFEHPTIAGLARVVANSRSCGLSAPIARCAQARSGPVPASFAQQRLWFLDQLQPNSAFYNIALSVRLKGVLQAEALQRALDHIVQRHETLRTNFIAPGGSPLQVVRPASAVALPIVDVSKSSAAEAGRIREAEFLKPFNLAEDLMLRARLLRMEEREHLLLLTVHHIAADGWSMDVLSEELGVLYQAFAEGKSSPLPELPVQYGDYAIWQRDWLEGELLQAQLEHWRQELKDAPVLELPTDRPRPAVQSFRGAVVSKTIDSQLRSRLEKLARSEDVTLFMTLLAGLQSLLQRYSGQDDIVLGSPISGRNRVEIEPLIGFFVNTLVLRSDLSGEPAFRQVLRRTRETVLRAYAHQDLPFEKLVEELQPERLSSYNPFCRVLCTLQRAPAKPLQLAGLELSVEPFSATTSKFDLTFYIIEKSEAAAGGELTVTAEYSTDLYDGATVERMLGHYVSLLQAVVENPECRVTEAPLLDESEREQILVKWNRTATEYPRSKSIGELFEERVRSHPGETAVVYGQRSLSYEELNRQANRLAHRLRSLSIGPESMVGVCLERSPELISTFLGIIKAGAAYVPLDPSYPRERLAFMIEDTRMPLLLTSRNWAGELPASAHILSLEDLSEGSEQNPPPTAASENLAYVIYTSGSTGKPKGACVPQRGILRLVLNSNYIEIKPGDRIAQASNSSFDAATFEIWGALLNGATLVGIDKETALSPCDLAVELERQRITTTFLTTALFNQIASEIPSAFRTLKYLLFGGEAVDPKWVREVLLHGPPQQLLHVYGPTETTTFASYYPVRQVPAEARTVPIGYPISNTTFYVLDRKRQPVPIGVAGELYIGGDGVAREYWNRAELTQEKFVRDPYCALGNAQLYRTGDLVRWLPEGSIEFLGRIDQQVKIRGFRVELEEIETVLASHPSVSKALVAARATQNDCGDKRLIAYVTRQSKSSSASENLTVEQVGRWQSIFDEHVYNEFGELADPSFNIKGWISSYTGEPIAGEEMREWLEDTVAGIVEAKPERVLEMGCGTGMLLFRIARQCREYVGADVSRVALDYVSRHLGAYSLNNVRLLQRSADDFSGFEPGSFDAVVLNSVVQYFPDVSYLVRVLEQAVRCLRPGGFIFLGDIRSYALVEAFHASVQFHKAEDGLPLTQLLRRIQTQRSNETELLVHPELFFAFQQQVREVNRVRIVPKRGQAHNELTRFRYQVLMEVGEGAPVRSRLASGAANGSAASTGANAKPAVSRRPELPWLHWGEKCLNAEALTAMLQETRPALLGLREVPNGRLFTEVRLLNALSEPVGTVGDLRRRMELATNDSVDPESLRQLAQRCGYSAELSWATHNREGCFDVLLRRRDVMPKLEEVNRQIRFPEPAVRHKAWYQYGNNPLQAEFARQLAPQLRTFLQERLPDYMVPSAFIVLDSFPLTPNGKVDRGALPAPEESAPVTEAYIAPRGELEKRLQLIWEEVLGRKAIGVHANFFDLGGHSLLAVKLFAQIEKKLGKKIPLSSLFQAPTIEKLAVLIREGGWAEPGSCLVEIQPLGSRKPIFWLHTLGGGGGGGLFTYQKLAELLGNNQPSYGLVAPPEPFSTIESMASHYIADMRRVQACGPYRVGGYCFGGIIAFEMARQLEAQGAKVDFVALLDSVPPNVPGDERRINRQFVSNFVTNLPLWFGDLLQENTDQLWWRVHRKARGLLRRARTCLSGSASQETGGAKREVFLEDIIDMSQYPPDFKRFAQIHWQALVQYVPGSFPGRVHLFRTRKPYRIGLNPEGLWNKLAKGGVELRIVPGRHENILDKPYVEVLAKEVALCLEEIPE